MTAIVDPNRNLSASTTSSTVTTSEVFFFDLTFCRYSSADLLLVFIATTFLRYILYLRNVVAMKTRRRSADEYLQNVKSKRKTSEVVTVEDVVEAERFLFD
jgi:hypothetical protein